MPNFSISDSILQPDILSPYPDTEDLAGGAFTMFAPAKINLGLRVLFRRPDGFHEIETLFQEISWTDRLEFYPAESWSLEVRGIDLDAGPENLVTRAAHELSREAGVPCRGQVVLQKEIPLGAGLGGGSSNAAVALVGLSRLWGLKWNRERLRTVAQRLGSDCVFFLYGGLARGSGRGEIIEPLEGRFEGEVVLVMPDYGISTAWAYNAGEFPLTQVEESVIFRFCRNDRAFLQGIPDYIHNDLENIVLCRYPELGDIKDCLLRAGAETALISGSGSTVFGIFRERSRAMQAAQRFEKPLRARVCRMVARSREF
ncbi:4-(cytidine 5'-diphospho)-2-C-methyl-D-erythritol kinase [bacterium]|nr:4-(cytidine 5'-diphospho)-2-C-methyl-D-erythritol kinase [bacterium]MBU1984720.1 4-(cytidine 5'-diphospho)-2-C-methyl-D-erythritol kinase [bacterium]